jgi:hypothetical protein
MLLRPNLELVVYESLDVVIKAAAMVAGELALMESKASGEIYVYIWIHIFMYI